MKTDRSIRQPKAAMGGHPEGDHETPDGESLDECRADGNALPKAIASMMPPPARPIARPFPRERPNRAASDMRMVEADQ